MPQTLIELTGASDAQILNIMPANGFPPETYLPMLRPLSYFRAICLPPRALWGDELPPTAYRDWGESADDLLAAFRRHDMRNIVAAGHSLGGIISMLTVIKEPARFKALVMLDPVILPPAVLDMLGGAWESGTVEELPLVQGARRRRRSFESREDAYCALSGEARLCRLVRRNAATLCRSRFATARGWRRLRAKLEHRVGGALFRHRVPQNLAGFAEVERLGADSDYPRKP